MNLCSRYIILGSWVLSLFSFVAAASAQEAPSPLPDYDPRGLVRFDDLEQAEQRRAMLNQYIWPGGLPATTPAAKEVGTPEELTALNQDLIGRVERLEINVGDFDFQAVAFRIWPRRTDRARFRFVVHAGHVPNGADHYLDGGIDDTIEYLLEHGCEVVMMQMPLVGWNQDRSGRLSDGTTFEIGTRGTTGHREMFTQLEHKLQGRTFAFFLEPVVQVVNLLAADSGATDVIGMIGLSGGGWTTHMAAAIDTRIVCSIPVAGAMPLYARAYSPGSHGDTEQHHPALYREIDQDGDKIPETADGIASWLEIFALGGIGTAKQPRQQIQLLNLYDSCCFSGEIYQTYDDFLTDKVAKIGTGQWKVFIDRSHRGHLVSKHALTEVLEPMVRP